MSFFEKIKVSFVETLLDAFGNLRTVTPKTLFDHKARYGKGTTLWSEKVTGTASIDFVTDKSSVDLTVNLTGEVAVTQTRNRFKYQGGKSQKIEATGVLPVVATANAQIGYFQVSQSAPYRPIDGIYFESEGTTINVCIANACDGTITKVPKGSWNIDNLDGNGPSGLDVDFSFGRIFYIDFQWLSLGRVRFGIHYGGNLVFIHEETHVNISEPYMRSGSQPMCYRIEAVADGQATCRRICSAVISEGGSDPTGIVAAVSRKTSLVTIGDTLPVAVFGIRIKSSEADAIIENIKVNLLATTNDSIRWILAWNPPTINGTTPVWTPIQGGSLETFIGDNTNTIVEGLNIDEGYFSTETRVEAGTSKGNIQIGVGVDGTQDVLYLCAQCLSGSAAVTGGLVVRQLV